MLIRVLTMGECLVVPPPIGTMQNFPRTNAAMMTMMIHLVAHTVVVLKEQFDLQPNHATRIILLA
jgi:hypothetical protein